jgi:prepilin-type N-terminal cleavage/methylation domain-containing protein
MSGIKFMDFKKILIFNRGFSIIEVMVAVSILTIGMIAVLTMSEQTIKVVKFNKDKLTASQLAQEGLELVRNKRDKNWLTPPGEWKSGIIGDGSYTIDYTGAINDEPDSIDGDGAKLKYDASYFFWHGAGTATIFSRLINAVDNGSYVEVNCTVRWREKGEAHDYMATILLYDWR